jgi:hypothetical protein
LLLGGYSFIADNFNVGDNFTAEGNFISDSGFTAGNNTFIQYGFKASSKVELGDRAIIGAYFYNKLPFKAGNDFKVGRKFHAGGVFECGNRFTAPDNTFCQYDFKVDDDFNPNKNSREIREEEYLKQVLLGETNLFRVQRQYIQFKPSTKLQKTISMIKNVLYELNYIFK